MADYKPYDLSAPDGVDPRVVPGTRILSGRYPIAGGLEHDELGHPTGSPKLHMEMTAKRRKKLQSLAAELPDAASLWPARRQPAAGRLGFDPGPHPRSGGPRPRGGRQRFRLAHQDLNPLPPGLENIFSGFNPIRVVEMNDEGLYGYGQLAGLLRARYCDPKIRGINKTDGLTWKVKEILERAKADIAAGLRKS